MYKIQFQQIIFWLQDKCLRIKSKTKLHIQKNFIYFLPTYTKFWDQQTLYKLAFSEITHSQNIPFVFWYESEFYKYLHLNQFDYIR